MISGLKVRSIRVGIPYLTATAMIKTAAREQGFEITEILNPENYVRRYIACDYERRATMMQMHKPGVTLQSILLGDSLPLLLPFRVVLREEDRETSFIDFPEWEVIRDPEAGHADYCMNVLYRDFVEGLAAAFLGARAQEKSAR